ncbi:MAG: AAA family ATPase [Rhodopirellula sp.]|nr:AAA family ATPase [Rhodopirellula sp.]
MQKSGMTPVFYFLNEVKATHVYWLWRGRIPMKRLTLLAGDPGRGKTLLVADLAARVSAGLPWPDAPPPPPKTVEFCPEPLLPGQLDGCPLFKRPRPASSSTAAVTTQNSPLAIAQTLPPSHPSHSSLPSNSSPPPTAQRRICDLAATADQLNCPYRLRPESTTELLEDFGRRHRPPVPLGVLFVTPEDSDSLRSRLAVAGADLSRICILRGVSEPFGPDWPDRDSPDRQTEFEPLRLPAHADLILRALRAFDLPALVIIDPLLSVLPPSGQGGPHGLAAALAALSEIAQNRNVAIVGVVHLAKTRYLQTLYRVQGSISLISAARAAHLLTADPDQPDRRILFPIKTVYCKEPEPIAFRIVPPGRLEWESAPSTAEPRPACLSRMTLVDLAPDLHSALCEAADWLFNYLQAGPQPFRQIQRDASAAGISMATLRRAKRLLGISSIQLPDHAGWVWSTEPRPAQPPASTSACTAGSNAELEGGNGDGFPKARCETE